MKSAYMPCYVYIILYNCYYIYIFNDENEMDHMKTTYTVGGCLGHIQFDQIYPWYLSLNINVAKTSFFSIPTSDAGFDWFITQYFEVRL